MKKLDGSKWALWCVDCFFEFYRNDEAQTPALVISGGDSICAYHLGKRRGALRKISCDK